MSPISRTIEELKRLKRRWGIVERFNDNSKVKAKYPNGIRSDLFGIFDIITMKEGEGIIGIQVCQMSDRKKHYHKITQDKAYDALLWLSQHGKIELWAWRKVLTKPGGKQKIWKPHIQQITSKDFYAE